MGVDMKKFALVLGGGSSKGYAHIGVLKVLEKNGIKPDIIVGTSMGALVGGFYSSGIPIDKLEDFQDEIIGRCNYGYGFSLEDALREKFHDKNAITEEEVFAFLENLDINLNNTFLMKDKLELIRKKIDF